MPVTLQATGTLNIDYDSVLANPTGSIANGDVLHAVLTYFDDNTSVASNAAFSPIDSIGNTETGAGGGQWATTSCYHIVTNAGSEPSTYTFTFSGGGGFAVGVIRVLRGVDTAAPIPAGGITKNSRATGGGGGLTVTGGTVLRDGSLGVFGGGSWYSVGVWSGLAATGWTKQHPGANGDGAEFSAYTTTSTQNIGTATSLVLATNANSYGGVMAVFQPPATAASDIGESAARRQLRQNAAYRMSPRSEREAQQFLRAQKRAYGFASAAA